MDNKRPDWLKIKYRTNDNIEEVANLIEKNGINTVCREANCPNFLECFSRRTATFMILGDKCTRNCRFCNVTNGMPGKLDSDEPAKIGQAVKKLGLRHVVITSVTRDDLDDGGAEHFSKVVKSIKDLNPKTTVELLIPDFGFDMDSLKVVADSRPDIIGHNIETVRRIYDEVRPGASYEKSLGLINEIKNLDEKIITKSGLMVGLGESMDDVKMTMADLRKSRCEILTIGQYLQPSEEHYEIVEYIKPESFKEMEDHAYEMGFRFVASGPLIRSSYLADEAINKIRK